MQAVQPQSGEAFAPLADGVAVTVQFGGDGLVGGIVVSGGAEDDAAAEGQGLRGGRGRSQLGQPLGLIVGQAKDDSLARYGNPRGIGVMTGLPTG